MLEIDLSSGNIKTRKVTSDFAKSYIGGIGFNAKILYDELPPGIDPFSEENILAFGVGTLVGSPFPTSARTEASAKSPLTNRFGTSNSGAFFGMQLKCAGFDALIIKGKAKKPVYVLIDNDRVDIYDATPLWGKETWDAIDSLKSQHQGVEIAIIGPAGEDLVRFANIENGYYNGWGRTGLGAVMGSKQLKAIAVRGTKGILTNNPKALLATTLEAQNLIKSASSYGAFCHYGSMLATIPYGNFKALSAHNFSKGTLPNWNERFGRQVVDEYSSRHIGCQSCIIACAHWVEIKEGKYKGTELKDMEISPTVAFGGNVGLSLEATVVASKLCRQNGLDMLSTGGVIAFAIELFQKGIITREDLGYDLSFGDDEAAFRLLNDIVKRNGVGNILAEGTKRAASQLKGSEQCAIHIKGLEVPMIDPRNRWSTWTLGLLTNIRGGDHLRCRNPVENLRFNENKHDYIKERFGHKGPMYDQLDMPEDLKKDIIDLDGDLVDIAKMSKWAEDLINLYNAIGICIRPPVLEKIGPTILSEAYTVHTGIKITPEDLIKSAERSWNLIKLFNIREGEDIKETKFPRRFFDEELYGKVLDEEKVQRVLEKYFVARGWEPSTGKPTKEKLRELGLEELLFQGGD
ncbi:Aldehyde ferredoxin oxidoreductase [Desulforamulus reducens MI-1]|uniref:Aldehyde ferredoxin oxidoreductase n=2 Tax=Desulforamulus TaxID=2916693 RepID=A4J5K2_DESRM|nr:Aldehyde ferredoxin oxidoreductase [Desulforamulus reducens MI-1]